jgi:hypothetical protein
MKTQEYLFSEIFSIFPIVTKTFPLLNVDVNWGKVTNRAYKVGIYDRFLTNVQFNHKF